MVSTNSKAYIHNNILDHSETGNNSVMELKGTYLDGLIESNTFKAKTLSGNVCMNLNNGSGMFVVRYNIITGGETGINANTASSQVYYNQFIDNIVAIRVQESKSVTAMNNTFVGNTDYMVESDKGSNVSSTNNIFYLGTASSKVYKFGGTAISDYNSFNIEKPEFLNGYGTLTSWISATGQDKNSLVADPLFVNLASGDFRLKSSSPCINKGDDLSLQKDFFGTLVPQSGKPDIGFFELDPQNIKLDQEANNLTNPSSLVDVSIYPNPTRGIATIELEEAEDQDADIRIFNVQGSEIVSTMSNKQKKVEINLENQKSGMYLAMITINGQVISRKIMVQNN